MAPMTETVLNSGWDTFLFGVPVLFSLVVGVFHLDELFAAPKQKEMARRPGSGFDQDGRPQLFDPDGRPSHPRNHRK
jgi:hypothetical protein